MFKGDKRVLARPLHEITELLVFGRIELSAGARDALLAAGVDTVFLTPRGGYRGRMVAPTSGQGTRRVAQGGHLLDPERALRFAQSVVAGKIRNQRTLLLRFRREHSQGVSREALVSLRALVRAATEVEDHDALRGLEGYAARVYFQGFADAVLNPEFSFSGRNRRPPLDPVNALLSFGYTLLTTKVDSAVRRVGLDPHIGALHGAEGRRPALALDLVEAFRPLVDRLVLRLLNRRQLGPSDFERVRKREDGPVGVYLAQSARPLFIRAIAGMMRGELRSRDQRLSVERHIEAQARHAAAVFEGRAPRYLPFALE